MKCEQQYKTIKDLVDHNGNKKRAALKLGISIRQLNRKIKQIERTAFGYSSFTNLLTRIRLEENLYKEKEPNSLLLAL